MSYGFDMKRMCASLRKRCVIRQVAVAAGDDHRQRRQLRAQLRDHVQAVAIRQAAIDDRDVQLLDDCAPRASPSARAAGVDHLEAQIVQLVDDEHAHQRFVFDDERHGLARAADRHVQHIADA